MSILHYGIHKKVTARTLDTPPHLEIEAARYIDDASGNRVFLDVLGDEVARVPLREIMTMDIHP